MEDSENVTRDGRISTETALEGQNAPAKADTRITSETARKMQLNGTAARQYRCRLRYKALRDYGEKVYKLLGDALDAGNDKLIKSALDAGSFLGLDFRASGEFVSKTESVAEVKQTTRVINFTETNGGQSIGGQAPSSAEAANG